MAKGYTYEGLPKTHDYEGERYRLHDSYLNLSQADWECQKLFSNSWKTRIAKTLGLYVVYKRRT